MIMKYIPTLLLCFLFCCTATQPMQESAVNEYLKDSPSNKLTSYFRDLENFQEIIVYEKYIVFSFYKRDKNMVEVYLNKNVIEYSKYRKSDLIISFSPENFFLGFYQDYLFIDSGTAPGLRVLKIISLPEKDLIYKGIWDGRKIEFIDDVTIKIPKYNYEFTATSNPALVKYKLYMYSLNLKTKKLTDLHEIRYLISN